jgi:hypothetical protein
MVVLDNQLKLQYNKTNKKMAHFRFQIKNTQPNAEKEGNEYVRWSGKAEPFNQGTDREAIEAGVDGGGNPRYTFNTGLNVDKVSMYRWLNTEEKEEIKKQIKEFLPEIANAFGGKEVLREDNVHFWGRKRKDINKLKVLPETENIFFDTKSPLHALLYLSIMSGAFMDVVAPNKDWALSKQIPHYLELESEGTSFDGEEDITRSDAHAALSKLRKESPEGLLILAWCVLSETKSFGGINKATPQKDILNGFIQYIDGKLATKRKRSYPSYFLKYIDKWDSSVLRPKLYAEAYIKAGEYFALVNQKEKKYVTASGTILGNTIDEAVEEILKPKNQVDLENLRDAVEKKWSE